tara:strand:+ start:42 stop:638 length:597 start_codon:yes stop_codon:yes gene_type:complete
MQLYNDDCSKILPTLPDKSVDLILTDPPYDMESLFLFEILLKHSERLLKDNGNLITLCGHHQMFHILNIETTLRKWWIGWFNHNRSNRIFGKNLITKGKPFLWYQNKLRSKTPKVPFDTISLPKEDWTKKNHKWEQPIKFFEHFVEFLTEQDGTVLDCFMGSGSSGIACKNLNRNFIGIEIDKNYFDIAKNRIEGTLI